MGVIPMQEDSGIQELYTRDHGTVKVEMSFQDGGYHIVKCPNGAYMHSNGLPVKSEKELIAAFGGLKGSNVEDLEKALNWFRNRHNQEANPPRPIIMHPDGHPVFVDGTVPDFDDLYAYFRPGKGLTGMIVALQDYKDRQVTGQAPKELRKPATPPAQEVAGPDMENVPPPPAKPPSIKKQKGVRAAAKGRRSTPIHTPG